MLSHVVQSTNAVSQCMAENEHLMATVGIKISNSEDSGPRWRHRKTLNSPPPIDTTNTQLHVG